MRDAAPEHLSSAAARRWTQKLCADRARYYRELASFHRGVLIVRPKRPKANRDHYGHPEVRTVLEAMFGPKCAYCEGDVAATSPLHVEHFRPASRYPALAYDWENLLLACERCNSRSKSDQFPVAPTGNTPKENRRNPAALDGAGESPLLLNPCVDDPVANITFQKGFASYLTERGKRTICVCGLNRDALVQSRQQHLAFVRNFCLALNFALTNNHTEQIARYTNLLRLCVAGHAPYAGLARQELHRQGINWQTL